MKKKPFVYNNIAFLVLGTSMAILISFFIPAKKSLTEAEANLNFPGKERVTASLFRHTDSPERGSLPDLVASSALVVDPLIQETLFAKREGDLVPIASLTKIMTALIALERSHKDERILISEQAVGTEGISGNLSVGETHSVSSLISMMMLESSNDAAVALAEHVGRVYGAETFEESQTLFTNLMNEKATALGMSSAHFQNPSGLDLTDDVPSNLSSARDLANLITYVSQFPGIWNPSQNESVVLLDSGIEHPLFNINEIARETPGLIGSKTGFTDRAGGSLVAFIEIPLGQPKILVILGSTQEARFEDMRALIHWLQAQ